MTNWALRDVPPNTIAIRVGTTSCPAGDPVGCASLPNQPRSLVQLVNADANGTDAIAHELGHAFGLAHVMLPAEARQFLRMGGAGSGTLAPFVLSESEAEAVRLVSAAGLRQGASRSAFVAAGLINP